MPCTVGKGVTNMPSTVGCSLSRVSPTCPLQSVAPCQGCRQHALYSRLLLVKGVTNMPCTIDCPLSRVSPTCPLQLPLVKGVTNMPCTVGCPLVKGVANMPCTVSCPLVKGVANMPCTVGCLLSRVSPTCQGIYLYNGHVENSMQMIGTNNTLSSV